MGLRPGDKISYRLMPDIDLFGAAVLFADEKTMELRTDADAPAGVKSGQYVMINELENGIEHYSEEVSRDGQTLRGTRPEPRPAAQPGAGPGAPPPADPGVAGRRGGPHPARRALPGQARDRIVHEAVRHGVGLERPVRRLRRPACALSMGRRYAAAEAALPGLAARLCAVAGLPLDSLISWRTFVLSSLTCLFSAWMSP